MSQVHTKFKLFHGKPSEDGTIGDLGRQIEVFIIPTKSQLRALALNI
ncbi:MAG: hypothetical protein RMM17_01420 [Acidobacteriota bacterium]|nr:hypothetical protein [Blastocatellia bacterium]MDW8411329.1 hypothetical protein [Acidobacteriota bacterium]